MSSKPYFPLYFSDLAGDTLHLSDAEMGSYILLLGAMWNKGGWLPIDHEKLARIARVTPARWAKRWVALQPFFEIDGEQMTHKRLTMEREKADRISSQNSDAGRASAEAKRLKRFNRGSTVGGTKRQPPDSITKDSPLAPQGEPTIGSGWEGPSDILRAMAAAQGEAWAIGYLKYCSFREDGGARLLVCREEWAAAMIERSAEADLRSIGVRLVVHTEASP